MVNRRFILISRRLQIAWLFVCLGLTETRCSLQGFTECTRTKMLFTKKHEKEAARIILNVSGYSTADTDSNSPNILTSNSFDESQLLSRKRDTSSNLICRLEIHVILVGIELPSSSWKLLAICESRYHTFWRAIVDCGSATWINPRIVSLWYPMITIKAAVLFRLENPCAAWSIKVRLESANSQWRYSTSGQRRWD